MTEQARELATKTRLGEMGLKLAPGQEPVKTFYSRAYSRYVDLYAVDEAIPKRKPTEKQLAALAAGRAKLKAERTCQKCGQVSYFEALTEGYCGDCWFYERHRQAATKAFREMLADEHLVILDTETTGLGGDDEIVEIAVINAQGEVLLDTLVKPTKPIPQGATWIHGITDEMVDDAPTFPEIYPRLAKVLDGRPVGIYNAAFDTAFLRDDARRHDLPRLKFRHECVMEWAAMHYGDYSYRHRDFRWVSLVDAYETYVGGEIENAHRALADCQMTLAVMKAIAQEDEKDG
jgi:DNA polymerase-3 subunit epsilon